MDPSFTFDLPDRGSSKTAAIAQQRVRQPPSTLEKSSSNGSLQKLASDTFRRRSSLVSDADAIRAVISNIPQNVKQQPYAYASMTQLSFLTDSYLNEINTSGHDTKKDGDDADLLHTSQKEKQKSDEIDEIWKSLSYDDETDILPLHMVGGRKVPGLGRALGHSLSFLYISRHGLKKEELRSLLQDMREREAEAEGGASGGNNTTASTGSVGGKNSKKSPVKQDVKGLDSTTEDYLLRALLVLGVLQSSQHEVCTLSFTTGY